MDRLEDRRISADVSRGRQTKTTDEAGAHVGQNVTVQVWHDHDAVRVGSGVLNNLQADTVEKILIVLNIWELFRYLAASGKEHAIRHFPGHSVSFTA